MWELLKWLFGGGEPLSEDPPELPPGPDNQ
jgi:hypothetical protein